MKPCEIISYKKQEYCFKHDLIAMESTLSVEIIWGSAHNRTHTHVADLLRTPGEDIELAVGLLFSLGIIDSIDDIKDYSLCSRALLDQEGHGRIIFELGPHKPQKPTFFVPGHVRHAGCGLCTSPHELRKTPMHRPGVSSSIIISAQDLLACAQQLKPAQTLFNHTGGTHAAALFDNHAGLIAIFEDVGRHNALDKLIGFMLKKRALPLTRTTLVMSSRASFEVTQKVHMAQIPIMAVVGAVSSVAFSYARDNNITLIGFLRDGGFNIYTHPYRITAM